MGAMTAAAPKRGPGRPRGDGQGRLFIGLRMPREIHPAAKEAAAAAHRSLANWVLQLVYDALETKKTEC